MICSGSAGESHIPIRDKLVLVGLFLSKYDQAGLQALGFSTFLEAYNVIGFALSSKPASIKNYRDEFDPLFPNARRGWHKRTLRPYCMAILERYRYLDFAAFLGMVRSFFDYDGATSAQIEETDLEEQENTAFAQRLITGVAAEHYFEAVRSNISIFDGYEVENTTRLGCGCDFRLRRNLDDADFLAVEVKGLRDQSGTLSMTPKEFALAERLRHRFYLFVVKNFKESPSHEIFQDPTVGELNFVKRERVVVQVSWLTRV